MANIGKLMKQAQQMQKKMDRIQAQLEEMKVEGSAGGGMVKAVINGKKELLSLTIQPDVVDKEDVPMLEDLVMAAIRQAGEKVDGATRERLSALTGGIKIPGLEL